ncbi:GerAB/ArcD/ProY family transporter [Cytobacillus dafuensis]|uniref:GerAB/ArcD/ProY family transporter n=1 Tax=Cytobacillus dafuensis TaxID=1742359 RepID=A0A5B8Z1Y6_CYTDA|nr:endospore germination permease [Cytobacillus dafuensis]QED46898.1 GerAB/ArcD/ProY family transporter [Cytobacillus dafuensis]
MKKYTYNEITTFQYVCLIIGTQIGAGFLSLPSVLAQKAGSDGWMAIIIGWLFSIVSSIFLVKTAEKYPNETIYDILIRLFGKILGKAIILIFLLYCICFSWLIMINTLLYINGWFLPNTPDYIIVLIFSIPTLLVVRNGLRIIGRYAELVFYLTMWFPLLFLLPLKDGSLLHLLPLFKVGWKSIAAAELPAIYSFFGFELTFFFYPFLQKKQYAVRGIVVANTFVMLFYLIVTLCCFVFFSPDDIADFNQPVLNLLKVIEFHFLERIDLIILNVLLLIASRAWIMYMYCAVYCSSQLMKKQDHSGHVPVLLGLFIGATFFIHPTWLQFKTWQKWISYTGIGVAFIFPLLLWIYTSIYEKYIRRKFS